MTTRTRSSPRSLCIVGGGTAGWMAAATLRRRLGCDVLVIESPRIPSIGVGEATIPAMIDWLENMQLDEDEFLRRCGGTYKLGIRFDNWITPRHRYWHPFGVCGATIEQIDLIHFWQHAKRHRWISDTSQYTDFSLQRLLCEHQRAPRLIDRPPVLSNYAFHLDAAKLALYLREIAVHEGVRQHLADVTHVSLKEDGSISSLSLSDGTCQQADLYLDCTGFAGLLIGQSLGSKWIDWSHQLLCDRAITVRTQEKEVDLPPYTTSTGLSAGWAWRIPLREMVGNGYVYSSAHLSSAEARAELLRHLGCDESHTETRELSMRVGRRDQSWINNCIALGLSSGFIEPLESTGIFLVQKALDDLVECLVEPSLSHPRRSEFNRRMQTAYEEVRDFVLLHYVVSRRTDSSFWNAARSIELPESLALSIERYEREGAVELPRSGAVFAEANHHFIMAGADRFPSDERFRRLTKQVESQILHRPEFIRQVMSAIQRRNDQLVHGLPDHATVMNHIHRAAVYATSA